MLLCAIETLRPGDHFVWAGWRFELLGPADAMPDRGDEEPCVLKPYYVARAMDAPGWGLAAELSHGRLFHGLDRVMPYHPATASAPLGSQARTRQWAWATV